MTKNELQNHCWTLEAILEEYDKWRHLKTHYERTSVLWKPKWQHVKNVLTKYNIKLSHIGNFEAEENAYYNSYYNEICMMPPKMYEYCEVDEFMGLCHYYLTLWHEIFHAIIFNELHCSGYLDANAEEMIIAKAVIKIVLDDICEHRTYLANKYAFEQSLNKYGASRVAPDHRESNEKFKKDLQEYVSIYDKSRRYCDDEANRIFDMKQDEIISKLKEVYDECRPA